MACLCSHRACDAPSYIMSLLLEEVYIHLLMSMDRQMMHQGCCPSAESELFLIKTLADFFRTADHGSGDTGCSVGNVMCRKRQEAISDPTHIRKSASHITF